VRSTKTDGRLTNPRTRRVLEIRMLAAEYIAAKLKEDIARTAAAQIESGDENSAPTRVSNREDVSRSTDHRQPVASSVIEGGARSTRKRPASGTRSPWKCHERRRRADTSNAGHSRCPADRRCDATERLRVPAKFTNGVAHDDVAASSVKRYEAPAVTKPKDHAVTVTEPETSA